MTSLSGKHLVIRREGDHYVMRDLGDKDRPEVMRGHEPKVMAETAFRSGAFSVRHDYDLGGVPP